MAFTNFIPEIWSSKILTAFRNESIWAGLSNREFEGELAKGNTIHIPGIVDVVVKDYKANLRTTTADAISDTGIDLVVNQEKNFDFFVDDIDKVQAGRSFDAYTQSATNGLTEDADKFLASLAVTGGTAISTTTALTDARSAWDVIAEIRTSLNKAKVPLADRILVVNPDFEPFLTGYDSKLTAADTAGDTSGLREASIGRLSGFQVVVSAHLTAPDGKAQAVGFHRSALAYVSQIDKIEAMRAENKFADRLRGLHVYGGKVLRPTAIRVYTDTSI